MTEEPGGLQPMSHQQSDTTERLSTYSHKHTYFSGVCTHIQYIHTHILCVYTHTHYTHTHTYIFSLVFIFTTTEEFIRK